MTDLLATAILSQQRRYGHERQKMDGSRSVRLPIIMPFELRDALEKTATSRHMDAAEYVRQAILEKLERENKTRP